MVWKNFSQAEFHERRGIFVTFPTGKYGKIFIFLLYGKHMEMSY